MGASRWGDTRPMGGGKCFAWDATVIDTLAESYHTISAEAAGAAAEIAAYREISMYTAILPSYCFVPLDFETLDPVNQDGLTLIKLLGHPLAQSSGDNRETAFLFQRLFMTIQLNISASKLLLSVAPLPSTKPSVKTSHSRHNAP